MESSDRLKEFRVELAIGSLEIDNVFDIAEDLETPIDLLTYLSDRGANLPGFSGTNFSSMAEYTLWNKRNHI